MDLEELRQRIDEIDREIIRLLEERFAMAEEIGELKRSMGLEVEDEAREREVLDNCSKAARNLDEEFVEELIQLVLKRSKDIQQKIKGEKR